MFKLLSSFLLINFVYGFFNTVPIVDQEKYLGRWYQMYRDLAIDITFENSSYCVTADYGLNPNNTISVLNKERYLNITGELSEVYGWASQDNETEQGQLTVHLQTAPFPAPYWIYALGPDTYNGSLYEWSIVSDPLKFTLFVLARNVTDFYNNYDSQVLDLLNDFNFTGILNTPIKTQQIGCIYL